MWAEMVESVYSLAGPSPSSEQFWGAEMAEIGGRGGEGKIGWANSFTYTIGAIAVIFIWQLVSEPRIWFALRSSFFFFLPNYDFRSQVAAAAVPAPPPFTNSNNSTVPPSSALSQIPASGFISNSDLRSLIDNLDEKLDENEKWDNVIDRRHNLLYYNAKCCKPKDGPLKYLSVTIFENCSAEMLRDFYMDNDYRKHWDKTLIEHEQLQVDESDGTEIGRTIKKFPLLTPREYILAWRVWEGKDKTFYCFTKECEHHLAPRQKKYVRVGFFRSGWRIRKAGRNACEIKMVHQEDAGLNVEIAKLVFAKGIWSYVCKMDVALRRYSAAYDIRSTLAVNALSLIQKVPPGLDTINKMTDTAHLEASTSSAISCQVGYESSRRKLSRKPSKKMIANGLIFLGGVICLSRSPSKFGAKVAMAYILSKFTKRVTSSKPKQ